MKVSLVHYELFNRPPQKSILDDPSGVCPLTFETERTIRAAHMCYCISFVILMVRSINFFAISRRLGKVNISFGTSKEPDKNLRFTEMINFLHFRSFRY